jgi:hypothetical protein
MQLDEAYDGDYFRMGGLKGYDGENLFSYRLGPVMPKKEACGDSGALRKISKEQAPSRALT